MHPSKMESILSVEKLHRRIPHTLSLFTLVQRLESQQPSQTNGKSRRKHASNVVKQRGHKSSKHTPSQETSAGRLTEHSSSLQPSHVSSTDQPAATQGLFLNAALIIGTILLILHLYLCYKLYAIDRDLHKPHQSCIDQCHHSESIAL